VLKDPRQSGAYKQHVQAKLLIYTHVYISIHIYTYILTVIGCILCVYVSYIHANSSLPGQPGAQRLNVPPKHLIIFGQGFFAPLTDDYRVQHLQIILSIIAQA
jgi:hypothetical protein